MTQPHPVTAKSRPPIALFAYNRADRVRAAIAALAVSPSFTERQLYVFVDGPKGDADRQSVEAVRQTLQALSLPNLHMMIREQNLGLMRSISSGVTDVLESHDRVIVLEDDLVVSPLALDYFDQALDRYADDDRVGMVCGYMYDVPALRQHRSALFLPFANPWGWATWRRAWQGFDIAAPIDRTQLRDPTFRQRLNAQGVRDWARMLELTLDGKLSSWLVLWHHYLLLADKVALYPPVSLVRNAGMADTRATHGSRFNPYALLRRQPAFPDTLPTLPPTVEVDMEMLHQIASSADARLQNMIGIVGAWRRKIGWR